MKIPNQFSPHIRRVQEVPYFVQKHRLQSCIQVSPIFLGPRTWSRHLESPPEVFSEFLWSQPGALIAILTQDWPSSTTLLSSNQASLPLFILSKIFQEPLGRINRVEVCPKKILNRSLNYCATTLAQRHHTKTTQHLGTTWGNLDTIRPLADLLRTKGLLWDYLATTQ